MSFFLYLTIGSWLDVRGHFVCFLLLLSHVWDNLFRRSLVLIYLTNASVDKNYIMTAKRWMYVCMNELMNMGHWWNATDRGKRRTRRQTRPFATLSSTDRTWTGQTMESTSDLRVHWPHAWAITRPKFFLQVRRMCSCVLWHRTQ